MTTVIDMVVIEEIGDNPHQIAAGDINQTHRLNGCIVEVCILNSCCDSDIFWENFLY